MLVQIYRSFKPNRQISKALYYYIARAVQIPSMTRITSIGVCKAFSSKPLTNGKQTHEQCKCTVQYLTLSEPLFNSNLEHMKLQIQYCQLEHILVAACPA